jgi:hypothetical protein
MFQDRRRYLRHLLPALAISLALSTGAACSSARNALVILSVMVNPDVPVFDRYRFSTPEVPTVPDRWLDAAGYRPSVSYGYYMPTSGTVKVLVEAVRADGCVIANGSTTAVGVEVGKSTNAGALVVAALASPQCPATDSGMGSTTDGGDDADGDGDSAADGGAAGPPRLLSPLSTATVTSRRPSLRWALASGSDGAHVQICHDRACTNPVTEFDVSGASGTPPSDLPAGVLFWHAYSRSGGVTGETSSPTWQFAVGSRSAPVNTSWGTTLDVNGDGYADIAVGAWGAERAYLYLGSAPNISSGQQATVLTGPDGAGAGFGESVASAGDVNGDGYADVIVSAPYAMGKTGRVYVYLGGASGISPSQQPMVLTGPDGAGGQFGISVANAGDVNGDGYADVIVGAFTTMNNTGRTYVYLGSGSGISSSQRPAALTGSGGAGGDFGISVASAGDVNGDGYADVIVGAFTPTTSAGRAYIYLGGASGVSASQQPVVLTIADGSSSYFGFSAASAGDVNGDGYADVIVGAFTTMNNVGRAYVYLGGGSGISPFQQPIALTGPDGAGGEFGISVASAGDVNGDGYGDLVVGAYEAVNNTGRAYLYLGSASGVSSSQQPIALTGPDGPGGQFGISVASPGDVNGDGYSDVIVGAYEAMNSIGRAYVYLGSSSGISSSQPTVFTGPDGVNGQFGYSVACAGDLAGLNHRYAQALPARNMTAKHRGG